MTAARSSRSRRSAFLTVAALAAATLAASCGGDEPTATERDPLGTLASSSATADPTADPAPDAGLATSSPSPDPVTTDPVTTDPVATDPVATEPVAAPSAPADACAALPSLELISATMGVALTTTTVIERGPGFDLCEAGGAADGVTTAQFTRLTDSSREQSIQLATDLGATVVDLDDPALPGGFAYAGAAAIVVDGVEYTVQTFAMDTLGQLDSPVAVERSVTLLIAWLAALGVSP